MLLNKETKPMITKQKAKSSVYVTIAKINQKTGKKRLAKPLNVWYDT